MSTEALSRAVLTDMLGASLTEEQSRVIFCQGEEAVVFALLTLVGKLAAIQPAMPATPTPSGMIPAYQKPSNPKRRKLPGRKAGDPGERRPTPQLIDRRQDHRLPPCPLCGERLRRCTEGHRLQPLLFLRNPDCSLLEQSEIPCNDATDSIITVNLRITINS